MIIEQDGLHPKLIKSSNTEGYGHHNEFLRRSDVIHTREGDGQAVFLTCNGRKKEEISLHNGFGTSEVPIKYIFDNFRSFRYVDLSLNVNIKSEPKIGKSRSGDMPAVVAVFENLKNSKVLTVFTILVDNLTPMLPETYGLWHEGSDSYAASSQRECLHYIL